MTRVNTCRPRIRRWKGVFRALMINRYHTIAKCKIGLKIAVWKKYRIYDKMIMIW